MLCVAQSKNVFCCRMAGNPPSTRNGRLLSCVPKQNQRKVAKIHSFLSMIEIILSLSFIDDPQKLSCVVQRKICIHEWWLSSVWEQGLSPGLGHKPAQIVCYFVLRNPKAFSVDAWDSFGPETYDFCVAQNNNRGRMRNSFVLINEWIIFFIYWRPTDTELCCSERPAPRSDDLAAFGTMVFVEGEGENPSPSRGGGWCRCPWWSLRNKALAPDPDWTELGQHSSQRMNLTHWCSHTVIFLSLPHLHSQTHSFTPIH